MLNLIAVEGIVTNRVWTYSKNTHCRLAIYPDSHNSQPGVRDTATFVTVRFPSTRFPLDIKEGMHIRVQGSLATTDEVLTLKQFLNRLDEETQSQLSIPPEVVKQATLVHNHLLIAAREVVMLRKETGPRKKRRKAVGTAPEDATTE